jgi:hypothetical protein
MNEAFRKMSTEMLQNYLSNKWDRQYMYLGVSVRRRVGQTSACRSAPDNTWKMHSLDSRLQPSTARKWIKSISETEYPESFLIYLGHFGYGRDFRYYLFCQMAKGTEPLNFPPQLQHQKVKE